MHEAVSTGKTMVYLMAGGIIPVRLILMFQPPPTLNNLARGTATLGHFIYSTVARMKNFF
jgi:hypothetical protein